jgi:hypothetical protein
VHRGFKDSLLDAPNGTGKMPVDNLLLVKICQQIKIAVVVTSFGISVTILYRGYTV